MPSNSFEDLLAEAEEVGVDPDLIERLRAASAASPLRAEKKQAEERAAAALERAIKAENAALTSTFEKLGIKAKPSAFNLPEDLDRTDFDAVQGWAVEQGLAEPPKADVPVEHLDAEDRIHAATAGAGGAPSVIDRALATDNEDEFWRAYDEAARSA